MQGYACGHCGNYLRNNLLYAGGLVRDNMTLFRWLRDHNCLVSVEQDEQCPEMQQEEIKNGE